MFINLKVDMFKRIEKIFLLIVCGLVGEHAAMAQDIKEIPTAPPRQIQNNMSLPNGKVQTLEAGASSARIEGEVAHSTEPLNILFLLDCSLSMKEKMKDHNQKIEAAKQVLQKALARIPGDVNTGLRVFGQGNSRSMFGIFMNDCEQTALLVPLGQGNRRAIIDQIRYIRAFGMTPLTYALEQSAKSDFANTTGKKVIILVSDGADTCGGDPCRLIRMLPAYGISIKVDVVGLDLKHDHVARQELNCITEASGGKYYDANSSEQFIGSVTESVNTAISGRVLPKIETRNENTVQP
jgi:Mg-chelatase subunit ChlD